MKNQYDALLKKLDYDFKKTQLLELALTHRSVNSSNNERLEYLGDAVLGFIVAEILYQRFPDASEGLLTRKRASLVKKETLADIAKDLQLGDLIRLGEGEKKSGGWRRDSILSNTLEALLGAIYLDSDFQQCRAVIHRIYDNLISTLTLEDSGKDAKTALQEYLQSRKSSLPKYTVIAEEGEAHDKVFTVSCEVDGLDQQIFATGKNKRAAEQSAAAKILNVLQVEVQ